MNMTHTTQNSSKQNLQIMSSKKKNKTNFINNQLDCNFFFSSKTKYIYNFTKPKSQRLKANHTI